MSPLLLVVSCLLLGAAARRAGQLPPGAVPVINAWVLRVALPALVLQRVPRVAWQPGLWFPIAAMAVVFVGAWLVFGALGPRLGWSRGRIGALTLVCGLGNTAFMGLPMVEALRGEPGVAVAVVADQLGCFPLFAAGGVAVTAIYAGDRPRPRDVARRVLTFPAFVALAVAAVVGRLGGWPAAADGALMSLASTLTPLALFSVGCQLRLDPAPGQAGAVALGLAWKLAVAPALCAALGVAAGVRGLPWSVGVLQAAMAPMISAAILASERDLEPGLANTTLGLGVVLSLLTVPGVDALLRAWGG